MRLGWRIIVVSTIARYAIAHLASPWRIRSLGSGKVTGSALANRPRSVGLLAARYRLTRSAAALAHSAIMA